MSKAARLTWFLVLLVGAALNNQPIHAGQTPHTTATLCSTESSETLVSANPQAQAVRIRLAIESQPGGDVVSSVQIGESFDVSVYAQDVYQGPAAGTTIGVFAVYLNLHYPANSVSAGIPIVFVPDYKNGKGGVVNNEGGVVEGVGSFWSGLISQSPGRDEKRLFSIPFRALTRGQIRFTAEPALGAGKEILLYEYPGNVVPASQIEFIATALSISPIRITRARQGSTGELELEWEGASNAVYVESTLLLSATPAWFQLAGPFSGTNASILMPPGSSKAFFRLRW
jgi:hypothetical protein